MSVLTRKWETVAKLFLLHAEAFSWWLWRLSLFWLSLSFQGRCEKWTGWASVPAWHRDWAELESCLAEGACAAQPGEMCTCFRTDSPLLGPPHHHNADPCDCNVNNPAFPERRGGASVKERRETVKYREIQRRNFKSPPRAVFTLNRVIYGQRRSFLFQLMVHLPALSRAFHF